MQKVRRFLLQKPRWEPERSSYARIAFDIYCKPAKSFYNKILLGATAISAVILINAC